MFTPDGSFLEDEATLAKKGRQKYLDRISSSHDTNFLSCQICGDQVDEGRRFVLCFLPTVISQEMSK